MRFSSLTLFVAAMVAAFTIGTGATRAGGAGGTSARGAPVASLAQRSDTPAAVATCLSGWRLQRGPVPANTAWSSVAASSPSDVWTAGGTVFGHWDGRSWQSTPAPSGVLRVDALSVRTSTDGWVTGRVDWPGPSALHWDGSAWAVSDAITGDPYANFVAMAALASDDVWAVGGERHPIGLLPPLVAHWDGATWSATRLEALGPGFLSGISHDGRWAVGYTVFNWGPARPLVMHREGATWSQVPATITLGDWPDSGSLAGVSDKGLAVGSVTRGGVEQPLVMAGGLNGWHEVAQSLATPGRLLAISGSGRWAVGYSGDFDTNPRALLVTHRGATWTPVSLPASWPRSVLRSVTAVSGRAWAVGDKTLRDGTTVPLLARFCPQNPNPPPPVPPRMPGLTPEARGNG